MDWKQIPSALNKSIQIESNTIYKTYPDNIHWRSLKTYFKSKEEVTECLYLEYSIPNKNWWKNTYIHLRPDIIHSRKKLFLTTPGIFIAIPIIDFLSKNLWIQSFLQSYSISPYLVYGIITRLSFYISYTLFIYWEKKALVVQENKSFENMFDVRSNDKIIARQLFDPSTLEGYSKHIKDSDLYFDTELYIDLLHSRVIYKVDICKNPSLKTIEIKKTEELLDFWNSVLAESWLYSKIKIINNS